MPITAFEIRDQNALKLARCTDVPRLMIIAGPNGSGKSTLLYCLKRRTGGTVTISGNPKVLYISPHRAWRKRTIRLSYLYQPSWTGFSELLSLDKLQQVEGLTFVDRTRTPYSSDESASLVKYTLADIQTRFQSALARRVINNQYRWPNGVVPDQYSPLKELTTALLPHLEFSRVDDSNKANVGCLWKRAIGVAVQATDTYEIDIDELSSGEKAVISLLLPFVERRMHRILDVLEGKRDHVAPTNTVMIMDEPELHLHPALQDKMLEFMRRIVANGRTQFIIATQSTTLVNSATNDELYLLTPQPDWSLSANQLVRLADTPDRLEVLRALCGETYPATACRAVLCVEGELPSSLPSSPPDKRLLEILCPGIRGAVSIPLAGRTQVVEGARRLREVFPVDLPGANVLALVDRDQAEGEAREDWIFRHPVCMIENYLLHPRAIYNFIHPYREHTRLFSVHAVEEKLREVAATLADDEVRVRVLNKLQRRDELKQIRRFHASGTSVEEVNDCFQRLRRLADRACPDECEIEAMIAEAKRDVDNIVADRQELRLFRGKVILDRFYDALSNDWVFLRLVSKLSLQKRLLNVTTRPNSCE